MAKKLYILIAAIVLSLPLLIFSSSAAQSYRTGTYLVTDKNGAVLYETSEESFEFRAIAPKGAYLTIIRVVGDFGYTVYDSVYGWIDLTDGCEYVSEMPSVTDKNKIEGARGIRITALPDKTTFIEGEESAEIDGLEVSLVFNDEQGSTMPVKGYAVSFPDLDTYGDKKVTVYYGGFSTTYDITVKKVPVTAIVVTKPLKTTYIEGEAISFDGLEVTAYYSDGRDSGKGLPLDPSEYTVNGVTEGDSKLAPGTYEVTVTYKYPEISASFHVYVSGKSVVSLRLLKIPAELKIYQGQNFNKGDFELSATYDNEITETITDFDMVYDNMQVGTHTARIYYMDKYVAFDYTVYELRQTGIELGDTMAVGSYVGDAVNFSKLQVYAVYNSGEKKLTDKYELIHSIDTSAIGKYPVTVVCGEFTAEFEYTVAKRQEVRIGDVNFDGSVKAADARLALRCSARVETLSYDAFLAADVDLDGKVTASDARKILRVAAGLDKF
ncbi:MAG: bacterial Ig-like domain-containing protein [Clostridia bacterium]|nr:bacterial Ig-like domain-containing protein [Clostridia bacterium]